MVYPPPKIVVISSEGCATHTSPYVIPKKASFSTNSKNGYTHVSSVKGFGRGGMSQRKAHSPNSVRTAAMPNVWQPPLSQLSDAIR